MIHTPKNSIKKPNCLKESPNNSVVSGSPMKKEIGVSYVRDDIDCKAYFASHQTESHYQEENWPPA